MSVSESENKAKASPIVQSIKFVWQSYKIMIDLVKMNHKMLDLHKQLCEEVFDFMTTNNRVKEAKKIFDIMCGQVKSAQRMEQLPHEYEGIPNRIELGHYEHVQHMLDLRYSIVERAIKAGMYSECYRAYEDIMYLMKRLDQAAKEIRPVPNTGKYEQKYYVYLSELVWVAGFPLHHSFALYREYNILDMKRKALTVDDKKALISRLLTAILGTPPHTASQLSSAQLQKNFRYTLGGETVLADFDVEAHYNKRMTDLFMVSAVPSRDVMIKDIYRRNLMMFATPDVAKLFSLLESEVHTPATFAKEASAALDSIVAAYPNLAKYKDAVRQTIGVRVIEKMGKYYKRVRLEKMKQWLPANMSDGECEKLIVACSKAGDVSAVIDNNHKVIILNTGVNENNRMRLTEFTQGLKKAVDLIVRETKAEALESAKTRLFNKIVEQVSMDRSEVQSCVDMLQKQRKEKYDDARAKAREEAEARHEGPVTAVVQKKREVAAKKQRKDYEKERLSKSISELTEQKKLRLKEAILKVKPNIKFNNKKLNSIPTGDITLKDLEGLKDMLGKSEEKTLTDYIKKEVKQRDILIRALREEEEKRLLPEWEAQTAKLREQEAKIAEERKKEHSELFAALSAIKGVKAEFETKFKEAKKKEYEEKQKANKKARAEEYKPILLKLAEDMMIEEKKRKEEDEKKANEVESTKQAMAEDKELKEPPTGRYGTLGEVPEGDIHITRAKRDDTKKPEADKKEEKKTILARPTGEEEKTKPQEAAAVEIPAGVNWRMGRAAAPAATVAAAATTAAPAVIERRHEPVREAEVKKPAAEESHGGWRRGGAAPKAEPKAKMEVKPKVEAKPRAEVKEEKKQTSPPKEQKSDSPKKGADSGFSFRRK